MLWYVEEAVQGFCILSNMIGQLLMIRSKITKLHLSPISLHLASSVHIPSSVNNFRDMLPTISYSNRPHAW